MLLMLCYCYLALSGDLKAHVNAACHHIMSYPPYAGQGGYPPAAAPGGGYPTGQPGFPVCNYL